MSCIKEILKKKGSQDFLVAPRLAVERGGEYKGYDWIITFQPAGFRCGYIAISKGHPLYATEGLLDGKPSLDCHGGVTFNESSEHIVSHFIKPECADEWIGFDAAHGGDARDYETLKKVFADYPKVLEESASYEKCMEEVNKKIYGTKTPPDDWANREVIRDADYMEESCKELIDSIIAYESKYHADRKNVPLRETAALQPD